MADSKREETTSRGNEWEVVSLTASAYAAAPGPLQAEMNSNNNDIAVGEDEAETSRAMFMSGHFLFPPSQHENLPLEPETVEIPSVHDVDDAAPVLGTEERSSLDAKGVENWSTKGPNVPEEFHRVQFVDEMGKGLPSHGVDFEGGTTLEGISSVGTEQYGFSSFRNETTMGRSTYDDEMISELIEHSGEGFDSDSSQFSKPAKDDNYDGSDLPCEAWWKRQAASLYAQAKEANSIWSIFIAAAVMGLVILGQQWQRERWQVSQLKWQVGVNDGKMGRMLGPISRLKDVIVGGSRRGSFIQGSAASTEL